MATTKANKKLSANNLKDVLWDTLLQVKSGNMEASQADSVATQAREILRTTSLQLRVASQTKRNVSRSVISFSENASN